MPQETDRFWNKSHDVTMPGVSAFSITPSATALDKDTRAIYVGGDGDITVIMQVDHTDPLETNTTPITFVGAKGGTILPIRVTHVTAATATNLIALY